MRMLLAFLMLCGVASAGEWNPFASESASFNPFAPACPCGITGCDCPAGECDCGKPHITATVADRGCPPCVRWENEVVPELEAKDWRIKIVRVPFGSEATPSFTFQGRKLEGYGGKAAFYGWLKGSLPTGTPAGVVATSQAAPVGFTQPAPQVVTRSYVPPDNRPGHWSHPGDIKSHLMSGPHRFSAAELEGLSYEQLKTLHDMNHESGYRPQRVAMPTRQVPLRNQVQYAYRQPIMRSGCPSGRCPGR